MPTATGGLAGAPRGTARRAAIAGPAPPLSWPASPGHPLRPPADCGPLALEPRGGGRERGGGDGTLRSSSAPQGQEAVPCAFIPARNLGSVCKRCHGKRSASRSSANAPGAGASRALAGAAFQGVPLSAPHFTSWSPSSPFRSRVWQCLHRGSYPSESLLAVFWHRFRCEAGAEHSVREPANPSCECTIRRHDTQLWLPQRSQGGIQQAVYPARLAHFTS